MPGRSGSSWVRMALQILRSSQYQLEKYFGRGALTLGGSNLYAFMFINVAVLKWAYFDDFTMSVLHLSSLQQ